MILYSVEGLNDCPKSNYFHVAPEVFQDDSNKDCFYLLKSICALSEPFVILRRKSDSSVLGDDLLVHNWVGEALGLENGDEVCITVNYR